MRVTPAAVPLALSIAVVACGGPKLKTIANGFYVDDVEAGKPSPHLY